MSYDMVQIIVLKIKKIYTCIHILNYILDLALLK